MSCFNTKQPIVIIEYKSKITNDRIGMSPIMSKMIINHSNEVGNKWSRDKLDELFFKSNHLAIHKANSKSINDLKPYLRFFDNNCQYISITLNIKFSQNLFQSIPYMGYSEKILPTIFMIVFPISFMRLNIKTKFNSKILKSYNEISLY